MFNHHFDSIFNTKIKRFARKTLDDSKNIVFFPIF